MRAICFIRRGFANLFRQQVGGDDGLGNALHFATLSRALTKSRKESTAMRPRKQSNHEVKTMHGFPAKILVCVVNRPQVFLWLNSFN
jgi:hypothetical protein